MNNEEILRHGKNKCNISYNEIYEISNLVKNKYSFSSPYFLMWKMFQFGFAYGKKAERARRKKVEL